MSEKTEKPDVKVALATFNERLIAGLIDYAIVYGIIIIGVILQVVIAFIPVVGGWLSWLLGLLLYVLGIVAGFYVFVWMPFKKDGQSFGKKQQNIKIMFVESEETWKLRPVGEDDLVQLIIRAIIGGIEAWFIPVIIAWYFITNDKNSQRLADQLAKTVVVQIDEKGTPLKTPRK